MSLFDDLMDEKGDYEIRVKFREEDEDEQTTKKNTLPKKELSKLVYKVKDDNSILETKLENINLKKRVNELQIENKKLYETKDLINQYKKVMNQKNKDIEKLMFENEKLNSDIEKIPVFIRNFFYKI